MRRPSPALVIAVIALFVSLGGTGYAAIKITGKSVKNGSLTGKDIKSNSVTGKNVKGLGAGDFKSGQLPTGPQGPKGATGPRGATGASAPGLGPVIPVRAGSSNGNCTATPPKTGEFCRSAGGSQQSNYGAPLQPVGYYKDGFGIVHLQGTASLAYCCDLFILPPGFRPATARRVFASETNGAHAYIQVDPTGLVGHNVSVSGAGVHPVSLDGMDFRP
jgi:hypothetical protein